MILVSDNVLHIFPQMKGLIKTNFNIIVFLFIYLFKLENVYII